MKNIKSIGLVSLFLLFSPLFAEDMVETIGPFGTLNNTDNPYIISSNQAQDLLNVDIAAGGKSIKKRKGYGSAFNLSVTTSAVHGVYYFNNTSGNDVALYFNDTRISASVSGGSPTVIYSTGPNGATYQCVDSLGYAYCVNTQRSMLFKTDGITHQHIGLSISEGAVLAVTPERLVMADFSANPSRVYFSAANDFTDFTVGGDPTDPLFFNITSPGQRIIHLVYAHGRIYWFKDRSFGYILEGDTQADWIVRTISSDLGAKFNTSIYRNEILYFQANDNHFYAWDGSNLTKLSQDIDGTIETIQSGSYNSFVNTSADDWNSGVFDNTVFVDTTTNSSLIQNVFPDNFGSFKLGWNGTPTQVWDYFTDSQTPSYTTTTAIVNGQLRLGGSPGFAQHIRLGITTSRSYNFSSYGSTYSITLSSLSYSTDSPNFDERQFWFGISNFDVYSTTDFANHASVLYAQITSSSTTTNEFRFRQILEDDLSLKGPFVSGSFSLPSTIQLYVTPSTYQFTVNGSSIVAFGTHSFTGSSAYPSFAFWEDSNTAETNTGVTVDNFSITPQTYTWSSSVGNSLNITSWDSYLASYDNGVGTQTFYVRASTGQFTISSSTPSWTAITPGSIPSISTGIYFQVRDYVVISTWSSLGPPYLDSITLSYFEGGALRDKSYSVYHDDLLWWSLTAGSGETTNNKILLYDLVNNGWFIYDIPMNGMYVRNQSLYFGSPSVGTIYKFGDVTSDNGTAIEAYWKSKDFFGASPFLDKDYKKISVIADQVSNSSMTVTYEINGSSQTSYVIPLTNANKESIKSNKNLPLGKSGQTISLKFGNDAADQDFEVFGGAIEYTPKSWKPE